MTRAIGLLLLVLSVPALAQNAGNVETLTATTTSATLASLMTRNSTNQNSWPSSGFAPMEFIAQNFGANDVAICINGGTCTCAENGVASTNGTTVRAGSWYRFNGYGVIAWNLPAIVSCVGSNRVELDH